MTRDITGGIWLLSLVGVGAIWFAAWVVGTALPVVVKVEPGWPMWAQLAASFSALALLVSAFGFAGFVWVIYNVPESDA